MAIWQGLGNPRRVRVLWAHCGGMGRLGVLAALLTFGLLAPWAAAGGTDGETIGSGDGRIHVIPTLSSPSVKNGERLSVQAIVKATAGVASVEAHIERESPPTTVDWSMSGLNEMLGMPVARFSLSTAPLNLGGVNGANTMGMWQADWTAHGLEEAWYRVTLIITDQTGHQYRDTSLRFSDPIAGIDTIGTTDYPDAGMQRMDALELPFPEDLLSSAVIDLKNGYAYFGTDTRPGVVVKVALGEGNAPPTRVGALRLEPDDNRLLCAVIDPDSGYAWFGASTNIARGRVVKVALGEGDALPTRVGAVTLAPGENDLRSAVVDPESGYAFFGTGTSPGQVVKVALGVGDSPPTRVGALTLNVGENNLMCAVIDPESGYAWFGARPSFVPGKVVKVALGEGADPPTRVGAVELEPGERYLTSAVIDAANGYAYFGTSELNDPVNVVKVALGEGNAPPTRVGAVTLNDGDSRLSSAVIDAENGYAYFGTSTDPGRVVKVALGDGDASPVHVGTLTLSDGEYHLSGAVVDPGNGYAYFGTREDPGRVVKVALGDGDAPPTHVGAATLNPGEHFLYSAVIDLDKRYAYFGSGAHPRSPGRVVKVRLGDGNFPPAHVGTVTLEPGESHLYSAVIDTANGYAYFGTGTGTARVVKIHLGEGDDPPVRVGAASLDTGGNGIGSAVIDAVNGYAYFGTITFPARVVKVALGSGNAPPTIVGGVTLNDGEEWPLCAVIDPGTGYAYFGMNRLFSNRGPNKVVKVALGAGNASPTRVGSVTVEPEEFDLRSAVIDPENGHAYFGTNVIGPERVVKIHLGEGNASPTRVDTVTLESGEFSLSSAVIAPENGHAWFGTHTDPGRVVKVALGAGNSSPTRVGAIPLASGENRLWSAVMDPEKGYAYFGTQNRPGRIVRVALSQRGFIKATRLTLPEEGAVEALRFYSHQAVGNIRLALYDADTDPALLWETGDVLNAAAEDWLTVPVSNGTPQSLVLPAGDYWLAWQVDTMADVASYLPGPADSGLQVPQAYGDFPQALAAGTDTAPTFTNHNWSAHVVYDLPDNIPPNAIAIAPVTTGPSNGNSMNFTVAFDEPVQDFNDVDDLLIEHSGTANTDVTITGGPEVYTVTVEGISGDGAFTLAVNTASDVVDLAGNALATSVTSLPVLIDTTAPKAVLVSSATTGPSNAESVAFTVAFDEPVQDFDHADDLVIEHSGTANTDVTITGGPEVYTVTVEGISGDGAFTLAVNTASDVVDLAGNAVAMSVTSAPVSIDMTAPHAMTITPATTGPTNATSLEFTVAFDEAVVNFQDASDLVIEHSGTAHSGASIAGGPESYTVSVEGISGDGSFTVAVNTESGVVDLAGNPLASSVTSAAVAIDNTPPVVTALTVSPSALTPGDVALIQFGVSEMLLGDPVVQVAGTSAAVAPLEATKSLSHSYHWSAPDGAPVGQFVGRTLLPGIGYVNPEPWPYGPRPIAITLTDLAGNTVTHTEPEGLVLVSGLPVAWPGLAALAMLSAAAFAFRRRRGSGI